MGFVDGFQCHISIQTILCGFVMTHFLLILSFWYFTTHLILYSCIFIGSFGCFLVYLLGLFVVWYIYRVFLLSDFIHYIGSILDNFLEIYSEYLLALSLMFYFRTFLSSLSFMFSLTFCHILSPPSPSISVYPPQTVPADPVDSSINSTVLQLMKQFVKRNQISKLTYEAVEILGRCQRGGIVICCVPRDWKFSETKCVNSCSRGVFGSFHNS